MFAIYVGMLLVATQWANCHCDRLVNPLAHKLGGHPQKHVVQRTNEWISRQRLKSNEVVANG